MLRERFTEARARIAGYDLRARLAAMRLRSAHSTSNLQMRIDRFLVAKRQRFERLVLQLEERSPLRVLDQRLTRLFTTPPEMLSATRSKLPPEMKSPCASPVAYA